MRSLIILSIYFLPNSKAYAQANNPSQFDKFLSDPSINYGMYQVDTIRFPRFNLSALLRCRIDNKEIKASLGLEHGYSSFDNIKMEGIDKIDSALFNPGISVPLYKDEGSKITNNSPLRPSHMFDSNTHNLLDVTQIIYVKNGEIKTFIPFVTTTHSIITPGGLYLGKSLYFSAAFNKKNNYRGKKKDALISLGTSSIYINTDSVSSSKMLKQMYGNNLITALGNKIYNKGKIYNYTTNEEMTRAEAESRKVDKNVNIPFYNENGELENIKSNIDNYKYTGIRILFDWKYNITRNIVFNDIKELVLYSSGKNQSGNSDTQPEIRIVY